MKPGYLKARKKRIEGREPETGSRGSSEVILCRAAKDMRGSSWRQEPGRVARKLRSTISPGEEPGKTDN
jgi:hypothetical protein